ncbi:MAG: NAD(P)H-dependent oxidoreductase subunit E [Oscillospiraceae bacterium]|nr:NAD(P)H-dependent oxidoreductase subunit E [Oscillospiraceae bacterium]
MAMKTCAIPFEGTAEQKESLLKVIDKYREIPGALMPILQGAQEVYGYLPIEVQSIIAEEMKVPLEKLYGIVTFYSQFSLTPKGKYKISICLGTACYVKGAGEISKKFQQKLGIESGGVTPDGKFSVEDCRCIGACGLAPVIMINDDVYGRLEGTDKEVEDILAKYQEVSE